MHTNGEQIAVKLYIDSPFRASEDMIKNELMILLRLRHQNIVWPVAYCYESEHIFVEYNGKQIMAEKIHHALCIPYAHNRSLDKHIAGIMHGSPHPLHS